MDGRRERGGREGGREEGSYKQCETRIGLAYTALFDQEFPELGLCQPQAGVGLGILLEQLEEL